MNIQNYSDKINKSVNLIKEADYILLGAGAGLSASGGLNYNDAGLFKDWHPKLTSLGIKTIAQAISYFWQVSDSNRRAYWAYWATHIKNIRYDAAASKPYLDLFDIVKDKNYFIITTNVDEQFVKAGFNKDKIFAPQGDYGLFQCDLPCSHEVFDNHAMIDQMVLQMNKDDFMIREIDVPLCPKCGSYLSKNLRIDDTFVEVPHMKKQKDYSDFVNHSSTGKLVLIELGVGFNTPSIIRWPFENIVANHSESTLIRMNMDYPEVPGDIKAKGLCLSDNISEILADIKTAYL